MITYRPLSVMLSTSKYYLNVLRNMSEKNVELSEGTGVVIRECFFEYVMI